MKGPSRGLRRPALTRPPIDRSPLLCGRPPSFFPSSFPFEPPQFDWTPWFNSSADCASSRSCCLRDLSFSLFLSPFSFRFPFPNASDGIVTVPVPHLRPRIFFRSLSDSLLALVSLRLPWPTSSLTKMSVARAAWSSPLLSYRHAFYLGRKVLCALTSVTGSSPPLRYPNTGSLFPRFVFRCRDEEG